MPELPAREEQQTCIIVPARFASTRFPGKPLVRLQGHDGERSLIEWSWRAARSVEGVDTVLVATDDRRIFDEVARFGGKAVMTPTDCANGTERCAAALDAMGTLPDLIVNLQGDAPLTPPAIVSAVIDRMRAEPDLQVATPAIRCDDDTYRHLVGDRAEGRVGGTTMVFDARHRALYFSKNIIPYAPADSDAMEHPVFLHLGVYAYRGAALAAYRRAAPSAAELAEGLEQLRFLDMGVGVGAVVCEPPDGNMIELNNPTDAPLIESELRRRRL